MLEGTIHRANSRGSKLPYTNLYYNWTVSWSHQVAVNLNNNQSITVDVQLSQIHSWHENSFSQNHLACEEKIKEEKKPTKIKMKTNIIICLFWFHICVVSCLFCFHIISFHICFKYVFASPFLMFVYTYVFTTDFQFTKAIQIRSRNPGTSSLKALK